MIDLDNHVDTVYGVNLGASPAELDGNVEQDRQRSWHSGDHEAELRLWEDDANA
jgi:hypothetical protein